MTDKTSVEYRLSRAYAAGWNAARTESIARPGTNGGAPVVNPYPADPERARWDEGYAKARKPEG